MIKENYQKSLDEVIRQAQEEGRVPTLLLHACCAPCSSYCLEYLSEYFRITIDFYNPNIAPEAEYRKRAEELKRLIGAMDVTYPVEFTEGDYDSGSFFQMAKGMEELAEGGERCFACYRLRLGQAAQRAQAGGYDYFTTTLTISPLKNADKLNEIGREMAEQYGVKWLPSDFKKKGGYQRSIELSRIYDLYRQNYCGCVFSRMQREREEKERLSRHGQEGLQDLPKKDIM
ncbi:epoxyqueuosine reductase QueH [Anaerolentibacter hominis]|uniref:epoxyqueuosine reductase QueH n=1 Tax=Anaerolentibacter hominis TaxID=3079009 RepID=UPI0031B813D5